LDHRVRADQDRGGMPLPIRMTVVRLGSGDLLLHSRSKYSVACPVPAPVPCPIGTEGRARSRAVITVIARSNRTYRHADETHGEYFQEADLSLLVIIAHPGVYRKPAVD
jgi:hypothetical protein